MVIENPTLPFAQTGSNFTAPVKAKTKLEWLLEQKDIFETLRGINTGKIRNYNELVT